MRVAEILRKSRRILLTTHARPDADGIGSGLGLCLGLRAMGKEAWMYNPDDIPAHLQFIPGRQYFTRILPRDLFDAVVLCDAAYFDRVRNGFLTQVKHRRAVVIDHHDPHPDPRVISWVDQNAGAVGEMAWLLLKDLQAPINSETATALYVSLISDTGSFRYESTTPRSMRIGAELLEAGVNPWAVASRLYESTPLPKMKLVARLIDGMKLSPCGRVAAFVMTEELIRATGASEDHLQGVVNYARSIEGVELAMMVREVEGGSAVTIRSRGNVSALGFADIYGGKGMPNAASFHLGRPVEQALDSVFETALRIADGQSMPLAEAAE
ncbi:MAG: Bifunctional oligoribonuclease and PAP phosphatase NrnA [Myxococcota bacterium]|nr:Bifunctional oligoribonuclease and PAP phosphatase NrnA [Myxococcota bacterium]